jgi:hypothetical protein
LGYEAVPPPSGAEPVIAIFSPKNNWGIIKIWNSNKKNDLTQIMNKEIIDKYNSIGLRYTENHPEF